MRGILVTAISLICFINSTIAQGANLIAKGVSPDLYIIHKIAAKENYYSVGRIYNTPPKEIAAYNNLAFEKGLTLGQSIKIPLTQNNFLQNDDGNNNLSIPVYHIVEAKEGLYRVSVNYNKVPLEQLKKWNNLSSDAVSTNTKLIVGYLKVQSESPLAKNTGNNKKEPAVILKDDKPAIKITTEASKEAVSEVKTAEPVKDVTPQTNTQVAANDQTPGSKNIMVTHPTINFDGGAFKKLYEAQQNSNIPVTESGVSGVFKSTSGWRDGKYYCFNNTAPAGTILKITNNVNSKSVYAKVLDLIPDINQNAGLILHVSNAAAEELGVSDNKFDCSILYSK
ncbi:MAG: LysM peptidoglycan-binding domain-containing protein [Ginsengibacter sp.]